MIKFENAGIGGTISDLTSGLVDLGHSGISLSAQSVRNAGEEIYRPVMVWWRMMKLAMKIFSWRNQRNM